MSERTRNFHHTPHYQHQSVVPPYGPQYNNTMLNHHHPNNPHSMPQSTGTSQYARQSLGSSIAAPNHNSSLHENYTSFVFLQVTPYSMEEQTLIFDAVDNNLNWTYPQTASSSHGNNNVHGGSLETRRGMGRMQYPEIEIYTSFDSGAMPSYTNDYHVDPHQPPPTMQAMRGNNFNSQPQVLSSSSYMTQMNPQPQPPQHHTSRSSFGSMDDWNPSIPVGQVNPQRQQHHTLHYSSGNMDDWNPSVPIGQMITEEAPLPSLGSIFQRLNMIREHTTNLLLRDDFTSYEDYLAFVTTSDHAVENANLIRLLSDNVDFDSNEWLHLVGVQMGNINVGSSNEDILRRLQIRTHTSSANQLNSEPDICVICQGEYENDEKIGTLQCGHEYHVDCIKKWLQQKNVCPVCKAPALTINSEES